MLRQVSGFSGLAIHLAKATRRSPSEWSGARSNRLGCMATAVIAPGLASCVGASTLPRESTWIVRGFPPRLWVVAA